MDSKTIEDLIRENLDMAEAEKKRIAEMEKKKKIKGELLKPGVNPIGRKFKYVALRNIETRDWDAEGPFQYDYELILALCKILHSWHNYFTIDFLESEMGGKFSQGHSRVIIQPKKIPGTEIYVETCFNNEQAVRFCYSIAKSFNYSEDDLRIYLKY